MSDINNFVPTGNSKEETMRLFIGNNADYYLKYYKNFQETSKKMSWNWSACILSPYWFYARKMYLLGAIVTFIIVMFSKGTMLIREYSSNTRILSLSLPWCLAFFAFMFVVGAFGNYFYVSHMESKVIYPGQDGINAEDATKLNKIRGGLSINSIINGILLTYLISFLVDYVSTML